MTPADIAAMGADMDAGTDGPWAFEIDEDNGRPRVESAQKLITEVGNAESLWDAGDEWEANARRIARVPAMEAHILALEAEVAALIADNASLQRSLFAEVNATTWQPIATAPKDGTRVMAYFPNSKKIRVAWHKKFLLDGCLWACDLDVNPDRWSDQPTAWMPLPAAPVQP